TSLKTSIKTITYLSDTGCLEIQGASLVSLQNEPFTLTDMSISAHRSKRTRRLACVGLGVFKEVLVVTGCCVPFLQNKITETIPNSFIESMMRQPHIYQDWCTSNTGGCRAGSQMCARYCGCNGNLLSCCCSYGSPF
ncbi:hypothetical protein, partial [Escherichia coli]